MHRTKRRILLTAGILIAAGLMILCSTYLVLYFKYEKCLDDIGDSQQVFAEGFSAIEADMSYGILVVEEGDEYGVEMSCVYLSGARVSLEDGVLRIKQRSPYDISLFGWRLGLSFGHDAKEDCVIRVIVPRGAYLDYLSADLGRASFTADVINAGSFVVQSAAGHVDIDELHVSDSSAIQLGIGSVTVGSADVGSLKVRRTFGSTVIHTADVVRDPELHLSGAIGYLKAFGDTDLGAATDCSREGTGSNIEADVVAGSIIVEPVE